MDILAITICNDWRAITIALVVFAEEELENRRHKVFLPYQTREQQQQPGNVGGVRVDPAAAVAVRNQQAVATQSVAATTAAAAAAAIPNRRGIAVVISKYSYDVVAVFLQFSILRLVVTSQLSS